MNPYRERLERKIGHVCQRIDGRLKCVYCSQWVRDFDEREIVRTTARSVFIESYEWMGLGSDWEIVEIPKCA